MGVEMVEDGVSKTKEYIIRMAYCLAWLNGENLRLELSFGQY